MRISHDECLICYLNCTDFLPRDAHAVLAGHNDCVCVFLSLSVELTVTRMRYIKMAEHIIT